MATETGRLIELEMTMFFFHLNKFFFDYKMTMLCFNNFIYCLIKQIKEFNIEIIIFRDGRAFFGLEGLTCA